ncbi:LamG domain-containing protein [Fibrella sp. HMF5335]|uniref:LamG domain-containing protein n=1 Tax=Fibrella rubiginis TaxID=2817060 RepID=A0A939GJU0_9BACT|nr:LamG domain-containing protein [Fibrella rubiginis]MBO0938100.1 LamG domain-containing protein [Fibrella rubiginis]
MKQLVYLLLFFATPLFGQAPTNGLIAYYPFNGNANDASGNGNNGVVQTATLTTDRLGNANSAYRFSDGAKIIVPNSSSLQLTNSFTFSGWMNLRSFAGRDGNSGAPSPNGTHVLFSKDCDRDWLNLLLVIQSAPRGYLAGGTWKGSLSYFLNATGDTWTHIAMSYDGTYMKLYINGLPIAASVSPNTFTATNQRDLYIGGMACWPYFFNGDLDDFRFYNRDLTDDEVKATFIAENGIIQSVKAGSWLDVATWSCNCIPTAANPVVVKHMVQIPTAETGVAYTMKEVLGGQVVLGSTAKLQLTRP